MVGNIKEKGKGRIERVKKGRGKKERRNGGGGKIMKQIKGRLKRNE